MSFSVSSFLEKIENKDKDIRHMALYDLNNELQKDTFKLDESSQRQVADAVLKTLDDTSSEVQGMAVKCLGPFVKKMSKVQIENCVTKLSASILKGEDEKRDIATLALKTVISRIPADMATTTVKKCLETLIDAVEGKQQEVKQDAMEVLADILSRFGSILQPYHDRLQKALIAELSSKRQPLRKRASTCLATLSAHTVDKLFNELVETIIKGIQGSSAGGDALRTYIQAISALSKTAGHRLGKYLDKIVNLLWKVAEDIAEKEGEDEVREYMMQAFESFVTRCPDEIKSHVEYVVMLCRENIEYDPNFSYATSGDDEEAGGDDEGEDDEVSDDDDISWKVRTAAVKCLDALIKSRPDMLKVLYAELFNDEDMLLINKFKERTESVKLEIFNTFIDLLGQTAVQTTTSSGEIVITQLPEISFIKNSKNLIIKKLNKQLVRKNAKIRLGVFKVLRKLVLSLQGGLEENVASLITPIKNVLTEKGEQNATLKLEVLVFLRLLLKYHNPQVFTKHFDVLSKAIYERVNDKYYKITAEALRVCAELVKVIAAQKGTGNYQKYSDELYKNIYDRLVVQDIDQDVKESAITAMGIAISTLGDALKNNLKQCLPILVDRLKNDITRVTACKTFAVIAEAKTDLSAVLNDCMEEFAEYLKKVNRPLRQATLQSLKIFAKSYGSSISQKQFNVVLQHLNKLVSEQDLYLAHLALDLSACILEANPKVFGDVKEFILPKILELLSSGTLQGSALESLLNVLKKLVPVTGFQSLFNTILEKAVPQQAASKQVFTNVGKSIAALCLVSGDKDTNATIAKFTKDLKSDNESVKLLALFTIGEIGRNFDLSSSKVTNDIEAFFDTGSEEIKNAASYSLGNVSVGALDKFLPHVLEQIKTNTKRKYLLVHSLKEVISQASVEKLKPFVTNSVALLVDNAENEEEGIRNVVAECLGKLALVDYATVMPKLKELLTQSELKKSAAISAVKYTITDQPRDIDAKLKSDIGHFLKLLNKDAQNPELNVNVRRAAVLLLNSAAHNKPALIRDTLHKYLNNLYQECIFEEKLIKIVKLGPFNHKIDQGLELRKSAFECLDTILDALKDSIDGTKFVAQLPLGLSDPDSDIKQLTHLIISKLASVFPEELAQQSNTLLKPLNETLKKKLKDNTVQQEKERHDELLRSSLKAVHSLSKVKGIEDSSEFQEITNKTIPNDAALKPMYKSIQDADEEGSSESA